MLHDLNAIVDAFHNGFSKQWVLLSRGKSTCSAVH